jgi:hypothetical protein
MIQRIQTLFLFGALLLVALCFFVPVAEISLPGGDLFTFNLSGYHIVQGNTSGIVQKTTPLFIAGLLICLILLITIFLFKNRILQIRFCVYGIILPAGLTFLFFFVLNSIKKDMNAIIYYQVAVIFPLIAAILSYLAIRAIRKDEKLVKSYDRLR